MSFDPHALKIYCDGNCWRNPGGSGGFAVRVEYGCDVDRENELVEYWGYFETNNNRMELRACIFAHEWVYDHLGELGGRILVLTDSEYVYKLYSWAKSGKPPYLFRLLFHAGRRRDLLRSGAAAISTLLAMGIIMDVVFQLVLYRAVHPVVALLVGPIFICVPYALSRTLTTGLTRRLREQ